MPVSNVDSTGLLKSVADGIISPAWTLLEAEGLGANLQHYNPMLEARAAKEWNVPLDWRLKAQLVFGTPAGPPKEKVFEPVENRLFVHGK